ncbi:hypothetical protein T484DRAFT_1757368 [Baffinella frigidus]|nr:hypothetical protein T484DRAFT_1757368 [Cryptophyta sp. CCMP2293]
MPPLTDTQAKKDLTFLFESIDTDTVSEGDLSALVEQHTQAQNLANKIRLRMAKREATRHSDGETHPFHPTAATLQCKDKKMVEWFSEHCVKIDAKRCEITAKLPGCSPVFDPIAVILPVFDPIAVLLPVLAKKSKPTAFHSRLDLVALFNEPDMTDTTAFLTKLQTQLQQSHDAEERLLKTINTRQLKLQSRDVTPKERKFNKGVRKFEYNMAMRDQADRFYAEWFKDHSLRLKAKIAVVGV